MAIYSNIDDPTVYFQAKTYAGNGSTNALTFDGFGDLQPNLMWFKIRSGSNYGVLHDTVRGITKRLEIADTLETTVTSVSSFNTDGFTLSGNDGFVNTSDDSSTYVGWGWKAGTSVSGNTSGSGTSKAYSGSVSTDAGFSIITYVANGTAGHTIPHHLGAAPELVICKSRSENRGYPIYFSGNTSAAYSIFLTTTANESNSSNSWNSTAPSSSVVTLGNNANNNKDNDNYIMYSFKTINGFSKFSTYIGNGNADGTFVPLSFAPAFVMVKKIKGGAGSWWMRDNQIAPYNQRSQVIVANSNGAETSGVAQMDFLSNGFKLRDTTDASNSSGGAYFYMAFAKNPFVTGASSIPGTGV